MTLHKKYVPRGCVGNASYQMTFHLEISKCIPLKVKETVFQIAEYKIPTGNIYFGKLNLHTDGSIHSSELKEQILYII